MTNGPILPRRRLGAELRRLRGRQTLEEVAGATLISTSKLSRLENGQGAPQPRDIRDLINYYEVDRTDADRFRQWTTEARQQPWWRQYADGVQAAPGDEYLAYESGASAIRYWAPFTIPDLLQTQDYARTIIRSASLANSDEVETWKLLELRVRRQELLYASNPPICVAILDEAVLHRTLGVDASTATGQLEHLRETSEQRNIALLIIPFEEGPHPGQLGTFTVFQFADDMDRDVVSHDSYSGDRFLEDQASVLEYLRIFESLSQRALDPSDSRRRIDSLLDQFNSARKGEFR